MSKALIFPVGCNGFGGIDFVLFSRERLKKLAAFGLLGILLFNWVGYRLYSAYLQDRDSEDLTEILDSGHYSEDQLITIKVPVNSLSYYNNSSFYERIDGEIEYHGLQYRYVRHRIFNDTLELQCIYDQRTTEILSARDKYFNLTSDIPTAALPDKSKKNAAHGQSVKHSDLFREIAVVQTRPVRQYTSHSFRYSDSLQEISRMPLRLPPRSVLFTA